MKRLKFPTTKQRYHLDFIDEWGFQNSDVLYSVFDAIFCNSYDCSFFLFFAFECIPFHHT